MVDSSGVESWVGLDTSYSRHGMPFKELPRHLMPEHVRRQLVLQDRRILSLLIEQVEARNAEGAIGSIALSKETPDLRTVTSQATRAEQGLRDTRPMAPIAEDVVYGQHSAGSSLQPIPGGGEFGNLLERGGAGDILDSGSVKVADDGKVNGA